MDLATRRDAAPKAVRTTINYALDPALGGTDTYTLGTAGFFKRKFSSAPVDVEDMRGSETTYTLNQHGFQLLEHTSSEKDFTDVERIKNVLYPETEDLLIRATGATKAKVFSHIVRRYTLDSVIQDIEKRGIADDEQYTEKVAPAMFAHVDQGPESASMILNGTLPKEEVAKLKTSRWGILNAWRPLGTVRRDPLAVCDLRTVAEEDIVSVYAVPKNSNYGNSTVGEMVKDQRVQVLNVKRNPAHRWYFASDMEPNEVLLITIFDTKKDKAGARRRVPHSAFPWKSSDDCSPRESIEVRCLVFWEDQPLD